MKLVRQKLYCFVDESGQDTEGKFFLVAILIKEIQELEFLETSLKEIEKRTGKRQAKWRRTSRAIKKKYLNELLSVRKLKDSVYYSVYENTKQYSIATSQTISQAVDSKKDDDYSVTVIIDGLNERERDKVRIELKKQGIKYDKIRGMKDEQSILLRLSDALVGFLREVYEKEEYAQSIMLRFKEEKIMVESNHEKTRLS